MDTVFVQTTVASTSPTAQPWRSECESGRDLRVTEALRYWGMAGSSFLSRTFASLAIRNYRLYFIGQGISQIGSWMQSIAQGLLVLELTGSGTALGFVIALQCLPVLLLGPWGGVVADR